MKGGGGLGSVYFPNTYGRPATRDSRLTGAYSASRYKPMLRLWPAGRREPSVNRCPLLVILWYEKVMDPVPGGGSHAWADATPARAVTMANMAILQAFRVEFANRNHTPLDLSRCP